MHQSELSERSLYQALSSNEYVSRCVLPAWDRNLVVRITAPTTSKLPGLNSSSALKHSAQAEKVCCLFLPLTTDWHSRERRAGLFPSPATPLPSPPKSTLPASADTSRCLNHVANSSSNNLRVLEEEELWKEKEEAAAPEAPQRPTALSLNRESANEVKQIRSRGGENIQPPRHGLFERSLTSRYNRTPQSATTSRKQSKRFISHEPQVGPALD